MANYINKYLNQSAYEADSTKQYPNTSLVGNDVVFTATEPVPAEPHLTVECLSTNGNGCIYAPADTSYIDKILVDSEEIDLEQFTTDTIYELTDGAHTIEWYMLDGFDTNLGSIQMESVLYSVVAGEGWTELTYEDGQNLFELNVVQDGNNERGNVVLPSTLTHIGNNAIVTDQSAINCVSLTLKYNGVVDVTNEYTDPETDEPTTGDIFPMASNIYVPASQVQAYTTAGWSNVSAIS